MRAHVDAVMGVVAEELPGAGPGQRSSSVQRPGENRLLTP